MADPTTAPPAVQAIPTQAPFDRYAWERALLASSLHPNARHIALTLAHYGGDAGYLVPGGPQHADSLSAATGLSGKLVRLGLNQLTRYRFIHRPDITSWHEDAVRPVTLTMPLAPRPVHAGGAVRTEPSHPSPAAS